MATTSLLPPGYCFDPKDDVLIYYLKKKINNDPIETNDIREANVYDYDPKTLTDEKFPEGVGQDEMFNFFTHRERKYRNGSRPDRSAGNGYWKATGVDIEIKVEEKVMGFKKVLVFYYGTASDPKKIKTNWIMHEYKLNQDSRRKRTAQDMRLDDWVLCRIYERGAVRNQEPARKPIVVHHQNDSAQVAAEENTITTIPAAEPTTTTYSGNEREQSLVVDNENQTNNQEMINFGNNFGTSSSDRHLDQTYSKEAADDSAHVASESNSIITTIAAAEPTATTHMGDECEQSLVVVSENQTHNQDIINFGNHFGTSSSDLHLDQTYSKEAADLPLFSEEEVEFLRMCCSDTNTEVEDQQTEPESIHQPVNWNDLIYIEDDNDLKTAEYGTNIEAQLTQPEPALVHQLGNWNDPINIEDHNDLEIEEECGTIIEALRKDALEQTQEASYQFGNWDNPFCYIEDDHDLEIGGLWN